MSRARGTLARLEKLSADHTARQARREALEKDGRGAWACYGLNWYGSGVSRG